MPIRSGLPSKWCPSFSRVPYFAHNAVSVENFNKKIHDTYKGVLSLNFHYICYVRILASLKDITKIVEPTCL